jgi:hypothetical protein
MSQQGPLEVAATDAGISVQQQVVSTTAFTSSALVISVDDTIPQIGEGALLLTLNITPTKATNRLVFEFSCFGGVSASDRMTFALFEGAGPDAIFATTVHANGANLYRMPNFIFSKISGTTSLTTYTVRYGSDGGATIGINGAAAGRRFGGVATTSLLITEYEV